MILPLNNTLKDGTLVNVGFAQQTIKQVNNGISSDSFSVKTVLCDDCGTPLVNGECSDCSKPTLL